MILGLNAARSRTTCQPAGELGYAAQTARETSITRPTFWSAISFGKPIGEVVRLPQEGLRARVSRMRTETEVLRTYLRHGRLTAIPSAARSGSLFYRASLRSSSPIPWYTRRGQRHLVEFHEDVAQLQQDAIDYGYLGVMRASAGVWRRGSREGGRLVEKQASLLWGHLPRVTGAAARVKPWCDIPAGRTCGRADSVQLVLVKSRGVTSTKTRGYLRWGSRSH